MNIIGRVQTRLDQAGEVMERGRVNMAEGGIAAENDMRNAFWRCVLCRRGDDCRDWLAAGRTDIPDFCPNRGIYVKYSRREGGHEA
ncbi:MAG: hypothetical protein KL840_06925 [Aquamicrobium sp.]|nr:hypothetical protein [Aquamicrobium sp.]